MDKLRHLPLLYRRHIEEASIALVQTHKEDIVVLAVCGGAGRGNVITGYSDIDLFVVSRQGLIPKDRYVKDGIKISRDTVSLAQIERQELETKVLYFLRALKDTKRSTILYGDALELPAFPFSLLRESSAQEANLVSLFNAYREDCLVFEKCPSRKNGYVLLKHAHAIMKNIGRIHGEDLDEYGSVNKAFYTILPSIVCGKLPTPAQYVADAAYEPGRLVHLARCFEKCSLELINNLGRDYEALFGARNISTE